MRLAADLRAAVLQAAILGKLTSQESEESAEDVFSSIQEEQEALGEKRRPIIRHDAIADVQPPFSIPENWKWVRLEELLKVQPGNGKSAPESANGRVRNLSLSATTSGQFDSSAIKFVDFDENVARRYYLKRHDILIQRSNSRELVGTSCIYEGEDEFFCLS